MGMLPPLDKLSLAARKSIRDNYDANLAELESAVRELFMADDWAVTIDWLQVYAYAVAKGTGNYAFENPGAMFHDHMRDFVGTLGDNARSWYSEDEEEGQKDLAEAVNKLAHKHILTVEVDTSGKIRSGGVDFEDGVLRVLIHPSEVGTDLRVATTSAIYDAISAASPPGELPFWTRVLIKRDFDPHLARLEEEAEQLLGCKINFFVGDWNEIWKKIKTRKTFKNEAWMKDTMHDQLIGYFGKFVDAIRDMGFSNDDMMQEAFAIALKEDADGKRQVGYRIVQQTQKQYGEIVVKDGKLWMQTTPNNFGQNIRDITDGISHIL